MFTKRNLVDVKKSTSKVQDPKKDLATRIKHLRVILENVDIAEAKGLFEANFSHIYNILYDSFVQTEANLRQRELSFHLVHKAHKEELECTLWILEQVLCLLPELIHRRWQLHSLGRLLSKLLHPGNGIRLRRQGIRYFLIWYQALNDNAPQYVDAMFASLVPGFRPASPQPQHVSTSSTFHDAAATIAPVELLPILPPSSGERPPEHPGKFYLEALLEHMAHTVVKLEWQDRAAYHHRCFDFLLEKFKTYYLPKLCPSYCGETSLYRPNLDLPVMRRLEPETEFVHCRVSLIMWVTNYMHQGKRANPSEGPPSLTQAQDDDSQPDSSHPSLDSTVSARAATDDELAARIVREVLCASRENVDFVHELYRQAFLLNFSHVVAVRKVISVYKDLMQGNVVETPAYALEPPENAPEEGTASERSPRLRTDSYLGAIHKENLLVRAGMQNVYQLFMTHAANVFLLEINPSVPRMLEEQTDACKRVLNIYRYMVMNTRMDNATWEQLLLVLLQITSLVLGENVPKRRATTLGGKLAPAIFQTLIVTWIKANLNVMISRELWDKFLHVLTSLTSWEELIKEWAKTLETLTRVLARHVYGLDLTDLPLDRLTDGKSKRARGGRFPTNKMEATASVADSAGDAAHGLAGGRPLPTAAKRSRTGLARSYSETSLASKRTRREQVKSRRSKSLDNVCAAHDAESTDRTRSPSPAPSSGLESNSMKDSPMQLDVLAAEHHHAGGEPQAAGGGESNRGVICGGTLRGWLPDVAVILWRRMLGALGDVNCIADPRLHSQVFDYLVRLTDTLIRIHRNQGVSVDNLSTPQSPELVPPLTLVLPWCFGALTLPDEYEAGKLSALRLLCTVTLNCDPRHRTYLPQFYRFLHSALTGTSKSALSVCLRYLGPRFLSLRLPGSSLLLLDLIRACDSVLSDGDESSPRTEAVLILASLLSQPEELCGDVSVLSPERELHVVTCPDIKEHVVGILLRAGRREPRGRARCVALSALGTFVYRELNNGTFHPKVPDAIDVVLLAFKFNNKIITELSCNVLFLLCEHAALLWRHYPRLGACVVTTLCDALSKGVAQGDKALGTSLLLCLGEWCMRSGHGRLMEVEEGGRCLLLRVFTVLHGIVLGDAATSTSSPPPPPPAQPPSSPERRDANDDFDPNIIPEASSSPASSSTTSPARRAIALCARAVLANLVTHLGHFPMAIGAARLSSLVVEYDDVPNLSSDELSSSIFSAPNIQLFILSDDVIASLIELPALDLPGGGVTAGLSTADKQVRVLLRDLSGKSCWDASILYKTPDRRRARDDDAEEAAERATTQTQHQHQQLESLMPGGAFGTLPQRAMRHRPPNVLPEVANAAPDLDQLDDLLQYLGHTSRECLESLSRRLNEPAEAPLPVDLENEAIASVINQRNVEFEEGSSCQLSESMMGRVVSRPSSRNNGNDAARSTVKGVPDPSNTFQQCRLLFSQLGLAGWERRKRLHLLDKTERLLRELRNLDNQSCRETHKFAVIYVAPGQEDKNSILSNESGSAAYEQFLASLAWEIELEGHTGFLGGLQRQGSTGLTAPYVATSFLEAIFHVATRMPGDTPEAVLNKIRHLGNDEVHIVWSEHVRDYRRDIIPTEFCDVLITIYPLGDNLYRVTVNCKADVPHFGVLFDEAMVDGSVLAGLVRATAICASRAKRITYQFYQQYYEERARSLDTLVTRHRHPTTYEEFVSRVYSPVSRSYPAYHTYQSLSGTVVEERPDGVGGTTTSTLTAALLDSHRGYRPTAAAAVPPEAARQWCADAQQYAESGGTVASPRPMKRLSGGNAAKTSRRSSRTAEQHHQQRSVESPPESPSQGARRK